jgi:pimeloyl-ACP methyl ester carboxylesterase
MNDQGEGVVERGARGIGWRRIGGGAPLVLLNGYAATAADWDPGFLDALSERFELVLIDHRGMGASTWGDDAEQLTIGAMAADVVALLDALGLARVPVVGWSMGGFVAQALAVAAPDRVHSLGLLGTDPGGPGAVLADPEVWARLTDTSGPAREQATRLLGVLFPAALAAQLDEQVGALVADGRAALDHHVLRAQELAMAAWHRNEPAAVVEPPLTFVAAGRLDVVIPPANATLLADRWHAPAPTLYDGGGHAFMAQVPQELAAELIDHLGH